MADKKKPAVKEEKKKPPGQKGLPLFVIILLVMIGLGALPITLIFLAGMLPTLVMMFTEKPGQRNGTVAIGALNFVGCAYVAMMVVRKGFNLEYSINLLTDSTNWLAILGGAALGYALYKMIPPIVAQVIASMAEVRIVKLKKQQDELKKSWGQDVAADS